MEAAMKTKARNRLKSVTTDMLIHVCSNARMQQKNCKVMYAEPFMQWLEASPDAETTIAAPPQCHEPLRSQGVDRECRVLGVKHACANKRPFSFFAFASTATEYYRTEARARLSPVLQAHRSVVCACTGDQEAQVRRRYPDNHTATTSAIGQCRDGIADDDIRKDDTVIVPISQFSFTPKQIRDKFGGDVNFLLRGTATRVMKTEINIKFDGDQHVSPYPKDGFGQFVKRRQKKATTTAYTTAKS
jgi:hypothetical protein